MLHKAKNCMILLICRLLNNDKKKKDQIRQKQTGISGEESTDYQRG